MELGIAGAQNDRRLEPSGKFDAAGLFPIVAGSRDGGFAAGDRIMHDPIDVDEDGTVGSAAGAGTQGVKDGGAAGAARVSAGGKGDHQQFAVADHDIADHHFADIGQIKIPAGMHHIADSQRTGIGQLIDIAVGNRAPVRVVGGDDSQIAAVGRGPGAGLDRLFQQLHPRPGCHAVQVGIGQLRHGRPLE